MYKLRAFSVFAVLLASLFAVPAQAQKLPVRIINRQSNSTNYAFVTPTYSNAYCYEGGSYVSCSGSSGGGVPVTFQVHGATLSLLLPDGRIAVVNCESKFRERMAGPAGNHRSCHVPLVDEFKADFKGDNAKLEWPTSIDGKKNESETYKILGILGTAK